MQKDTSLPPPSVPSASNSALGARQQASVSAVPTKSETRCPTRPRTHRKPSISKVILGVMAEKGEHNRVSLSALKNALSSVGYDTTRNACRFKRVLKELLDKGMLKKVTGKGISGSFRMGKKHPSKIKLKTNEQQEKQRKQQQQSGQYRSRQGQSGQSRSGQHRLPPNSKQGQKWLIEGVSRVAKCLRNE